MRDQLSGNVILFFSHPRAPSRAASSASTSAVIPFCMARGDETIERHHSGGIRSRCFHLRTAAGPAPISEAKASGDGQSPITDRKLEASDIKPLIGQFVLERKAKMSRASNGVRRQNRPMGDEPAKSLYKKQFQHRVREARMASGYTQEEMADLLNLGEGGQGKYKQWETRDFLPHHVIPRFCLIAKINADWLFTGQGRAPGEAINPPQRLAKAAKRAVSKRRSKAA